VGRLLKNSASKPLGIVSFSVFNFHKNAHYNFLLFSTKTTKKNKVNISGGALGGLLIDTQRGEAPEAVCQDNKVIKAGSSAIIS
jgi:hypothetical protein